MLLNLEAQLTGEAHSTKHAHRIFLVTLLGLPDQTYLLITDVVDTIGKIMNLAAGNVVVKRIDSEVAALGVLFEGAVYVIAQQSPRLTLA